MLKRKLSSLIILSTIATPVAMVVSCGSNSTDEVIGIQEFKITNDSRDVSEDVVSVIEKHFSDYIQEGVEAQALKSIHFFDETNSPYSDEGDYLSDSNELIINTKLMSSYRNFTEDDKANYLMQLLAHEYNHFVDHSYLVNILSSSSEVDHSVHDWNNDGKVVPWPKAFLSKFKTLLKYDEDTKLYPHSSVLGKFNSLGSIYNQKNLFEMANGVDDPSALYTKLQGVEVMAPINPIVEVSEHRIITKNALSYIYSMDELFARKMQIITSSYHGSTHFGEDGFMTIPSGKTESPYLQDVVNYQRGLDDFDNEGLYLNDKPTKELATLYNDIRGREDDCISFVENKNDEYIQSDGTFKGTIDRTMIRFGGNIKLTNDNTNKYLGYEDNGVFINVPIEIKKVDNDQIKNTFLSSFVKAADIVNKKLYFATDVHGSDKILINKTRDSKYGTVTTHRYLDPSSALNFEFSNDAILQNI